MTARYLVVLTESELHLACHLLATMVQEGRVGEPTVALLDLLQRSPEAHAPPRLDPATAGRPYDLGTARAIRAVLWTEESGDVLLLECGHIVTRRLRAGRSRAYCEGCGVCQPIEATC